MKKFDNFSKLLLLFLFVSTTLVGQYTGSYADVATFKDVETSDTLVGFEPEYAVDDTPGTYCAVPGPAEAWIQIDLGAFFVIDGYSITLPLAGSLPREYVFQVSEDAVVWTDIGTELITTDDTYGFDIVSPDPIRYVRINMTDMDVNASFSEILVYGYELMPPEPPLLLPATNITSTGFMANWDESEFAQGYVLSVATDAAFLNLVSGYEDLWAAAYTAWDVTDLDPGISYYYRVRAYNLAGTSSYGNIIALATNKEAQDISFTEPLAVMYGDADFNLDATASSGLDVTFTSSDQTVATISGMTVTIVGTGTTSITATQEGNDQYLAADPVAQDLVVNTKELTVINALAENKSYDGTTDAIISGATLEGIVGTDDVSLSGAETGLFAQADVGAGIEVSVSMSLSGEAMGNYTLLAPSDLTADITPKDLLALADDKSREECDANPAFTITYTGFVGDEDFSVLDTAPTASCLADGSSADGTYDITVSGGSDINYLFTYEPGTLTITPDATAPVLEVKNLTVQLDESGNAIITAADLVINATDNCTIADTTLSQSTFSDSDIGDVSVELTLSDASGNESTETAVVTVIGYVGVEEAGGIQARVYPNPTYGIVQLELNRFADELKVLDMTGKTLQRKTDVGSEDAIDLSAYHSGIYLIYLKFGDEVMYYKVMKK